MKEKDENNGDGVEDSMSEWMKIMLEEMDRKRSQHEEDLDELAERSTASRDGEKSGGDGA